MFEATLLEIEETPDGRQGKVVNKGVRMTVSLDLVLDAQAGDTVLIQGRMALSLVEDGNEIRG